MKANEVMQLIEPEVSKFIVQNLSQIIEYKKYLLDNPTLYREFNIRFAFDIFWHTRLFISDEFRQSGISDKNIEAAMIKILKKHNLL